MSAHADVRMSSDIMLNQGLEKPLISTDQTKAKILKENLSALTSENMHLKKGMACSHEREKALEKKLEEFIRKIRVLENAEENLCEQLAELEAETLEQNLQHKANLTKLTSELQQKEALIASLASDIHKNRSTIHEHEASAGNDATPDLCLSLTGELSEANSLLRSLQRKHLKTLAALESTESEIVLLKSTIDTLKAEILRLEYAKRTQADLLKTAQKQIESLKGSLNSPPIKNDDAIRTYLLGFKFPKSWLMVNVQRRSSGMVWTKNMLC